MKMKQTLTVLGFFAMACVHAQNIGINNTNTAPFAGAILDVQSTNKGMLLPRMTTVQRLALTSLTQGLIVYDTDLNLFFYFTNSWQPLSTGSGSGWALGGNAGIATDQFVGTTDAATLRFRTNNLDRLSIDGNGNILVASNQQTLRFASNLTSPNQPMMQMFPFGTANRDRMVISHSPSFPLWGLEYRDTTDAFFFRSSDKRNFAFELFNGHMGIGVEDPEFPLDAVGRLRLRSDGTLSNSPGIWFSNQSNTFDRAFFGMHRPDSILGIYSQHLDEWAIEFEVMREPRIGIGSRKALASGISGFPPRAELHLVHTDFGGSNDGVRIQNEGTNENYWNIYTSNATGALEFFQRGIKRATISLASGAYTAVSDERLKKNVRPMSSDMLSKVMQLRPTTYQFVDMPNDEGQYFRAGNRFYNGFIAQEVEKIFPELVFRGSDNPAQDFYTMDYSGFGIIGIKAIQEQQAIITKQQTEIDELKAQLSALNKQVQAVLNKVPVQ